MTGTIDAGSYENPIIARLGINECTYVNQIKLNNHKIEGTDEELKEMITKTKNIEGKLNLRNTFLDKSIPEYLAFINGYVAMETLKHKHGDDYMLPILGLRKPKSLGEKMNYWFFGKFPKQK